MNWAPLDIRPLRVVFYELFAYLESMKDLHALFEQEEQRLTCLQAHLEVRRQELDLPTTPQNKTLTAQLMLQGSIDRTRGMLANLERQYEFQQ